MIERIIEYSCRNKFLVILAFVGLAAGGTYVALHTPVDAIPDLSENQVIVFTDWMGRSPKEIEDQITYPLSVNLQGLAGVKAIRASSEFNFSMINIIFEDSVDFYFARTRVLERLALANTFLPPGVVPYLAPDATALGQIFWYSVEGGNVDLGTLRAIQDWDVRYQLNSVPGVAQVSSLGGFPREYQVDVTPEKLRAYDITLGQIFGALSRSNSSVGGRVVHKGNAEYLIRGVGWIKSIEDIRDTVIVDRGSVPIRVGDVATVQMGSEFRRSVLEKDGREVAGGVVMMRYGENPLAVTERVKEKIRDLEKGLPEGVRIVPFYDRTRLIEDAIGTVTHELRNSALVACLAILLVLTHLRSTLVVLLVLPLSIAISLVLMKLLGISSNIMSLSGMTISIGVLVDQPIVMLENATHTLTQQYGDRRVTGDTTEIIVKACRLVGRPIFFSVIIMIITFLPVFALTGQEGKLFHPLAYTKTFCLLGGAIIAITLVPALIPLLIRGRLSREEDNWIVRSVIAIYKPVLLFLMGRPRMVITLFVLLLALGFHLARGLGREFMPPLDEGSLMDMPVTVPRASVTEVADDIKVRDALIRAFPEVETVVGKAGRAETPTDPSPLDMIETIIMLRPKEHWAKRKLRSVDAQAEARHVVAWLESDGSLKAFVGEKERNELADVAASDALTRFDAVMRMEVARRFSEHDEELARESLRFVVDRLLNRLSVNSALTHPLSDTEREALIADLQQAKTARFLVNPRVPDIEDSGKWVLQRLADEKRLESSVRDVLAPAPGIVREAVEGATRVFGGEVKDFYHQVEDELTDFRSGRTVEFVGKANRALFPFAMTAFEESLLREIERHAGMQEAWIGKPVPTVERLASDFGGRVFLWHKTKQDIVNEMDGAVRQLGWANIWTQPIINRVDMLATGVRTQIGVKVFGNNPAQIQELSNQVAQVLREIPGAVDVVPDQTVGKGYIEIEIDRERAARYGINVGDIQDLIEVALGGKPVTTTVEDRQRFPVRVRYARDFRVDEESIRKILVSKGGMGRGMGPSGSPAGAMVGGSEVGTGESDGIGMTGAGMGGSENVPIGGLVERPGGKLDASVLRGGDLALRSQPAVFLEDVARIRVIEGPVMIKSENGKLRSYVQLNVRDRDIVGFVEEAQRAVDAKVARPVGTSIEWAGQFENQVRARRTLSMVFPAVVLLIFVILYVTYHDFMHALLMMLAVPGALAGGVIFQVFFGYNFSVAVWVGYIACFGMATETGIIMLVYLREAIEARGGLAKIASLAELEDAVVKGAVHRLRPKLLTEGTTIVGLAPMVWSSGTGAEVIAPMAAPVLGGILIADEVIDAFLPVLFYHVEAWRWLVLNPSAPRSTKLWVPYPVELWISWKARRRAVA